MHPSGEWKFSAPRQFFRPHDRNEEHTFDILKSNISQSGTQESGDILDTTAFEFCKSGQRTCKLNHFYLWLRWKDEDV
jgi:hypothetical protein